MKNELNLSTRHHLQLALHNLMARLGIDGLKKVQLTSCCIGDGSNAFQLCIDGDKVFLPSALLWRSYRRGFENRLARLSEEFGMGTVFSVNNGDTVIDIGANVGDFAQACESFGALCYSFDGDPHAVQCMKANLAETTSVVITEAILWNKNEEVTFFSAPDRADSSLFQPPGKCIEAFRAQAYTLDYLAKKLEIGDVALLKMDAEGAEPEVLLGAQEVLKRTRAVAIDTGPERNGEETHDEVCEVLTAAGFEVLPRGNRQNRKITMATRPFSESAANA